MRITYKEKEMSNISEVMPKRWIFCLECLDNIKGEPVWRQLRGNHHGQFYSYFCKKCYPTKEALLNR